MELDKESGFKTAKPVFDNSAGENIFGNMISEWPYVATGSPNSTTKIAGLNFTSPFVQGAIGSYR